MGVFCLLLSLLCLFLGILFVCFFVGLFPAVVVVFLSLCLLFVCVLLLLYVFVSVSISYLSVSVSVCEWGLRGVSQRPLYVCMHVSVWCHLCLSLLVCLSLSASPLSALSTPLMQPVLLSPVISISLTSNQGSASSPFFSPCLFLCLTLHLIPSTIIRISVCLCLSVSACLCLSVCVSLSLHRLIPTPPLPYLPSTF